MKVVGDYLHDTAKSHPEYDLFARSAFNRYYYSCFLTARHMHGIINPKKRVPSHKDFPDIIIGSLCQKIKQQAREAVKNGTLKEGTSKAIVAAAMKASSDFSNLLVEAYKVRCTADYEPDIRVSKTGERFQLGSASLDRAVRWPQRADICASMILNAWRQLGH